MQSQEDLWELESTSMGVTLLNLGSQHLPFQRWLWGHLCIFVFSAFKLLWVLGLRTFASAAPFCLECSSSSTGNCVIQLSV